MTAFNATADPLGDAVVLGRGALVVFVVLGAIGGAVVGALLAHRSGWD